MTQEEVMDRIESYNKQLEDYQLQIEELSKKEEISDDDQAVFHYLMGKVEVITEELEVLVSQL